MLDDSGMKSKHQPSEPLPLNQAARCLRVPAAWLREEVEAGRVGGRRQHCSDQMRLLDRPADRQPHLWAWG